MGAYTARGLVVQPFKVGPDFLDGQHHVMACATTSTHEDEPPCTDTQQRHSVNLDGWMMGGREAVLASFQTHAKGADICIVEGVMGLHDGKDGHSDDGSSAQIAKRLETPVVLVVDAHSMCRSVAAMLLGYLALDPVLRLSAVVVNQVNTVRHLEWIQQALEDDDRLVDVATGRPLVLAGAMPKDKRIAIAERHLGLVAPHPDDDIDRFTLLAQVAEEHFNLDALFQLAQTARPPLPPVCQMGYAQVEMLANPIFQVGRICRGQRFHFSEDVDEQSVKLSPAFQVMPQNPAAVVEDGGYIVYNVVASYFHLHWASEPLMARDFVESAIRNSPIRKSYAVSFVSVATEIAFALGVGDALAGVTSVCDYPAHTQAYPRRVLCRSPFDASTMTSEQVAVKREEMRTRKSSDGPPGHWLIDKAGLKEVDPQIVFVQETCDICDSSESDVLAALEHCHLTGTCNTVQVSPTTLEGMLQAIEDVGGALGVPTESEELCARLRKRLENVTRKLAAVGPTRRRVLSLEGLAAICVGGGWLPDVKVAAGCEDALGDVGGAPPRILTWEQVAEADPDILVLSPCSGSPSRTLNELHLLNTPAFWRLRCVRNGDVYVIAHDKFSRPGPRLVDGIEMLAVLLHGISPPDHIIVAEEWRGEALKYECCVGKLKHCTTELSTRFRPCFGSANSHTDENTFGDNARSFDSSRGLQRIRVTPSSIPGDHLPCRRSAHNLATLKDGSGLLFAGEDDEAIRLNDLWKLSPPSKGWNSADLFDIDAAPRLGCLPVWERLQYSKVADEDVPTIRSNSAAVVCGEYMLVFGGWGQDSQYLDNCELLHLVTRCWTHCSTRGNARPPPRGNPTLVYSEKENAAILFGGWDTVRRRCDLWVLNMDVWEWKRQEPINDIWPRGRTDHTSVLWTADNVDELMIVFGGSVEGQGTSSELWILDVGCGKWREILSSGPRPRTSHCAVIVGDFMVVVGGTGNGSGASALLGDAWMLSLHNMSWSKLDWSGQGLYRCRHSMTVTDDGDFLIWGGYNGASSVRDDASVWLASVRDLASFKPTNKVPKQASQVDKRLQEQWQAQIPLRESDLPDDVRIAARKSKLPGALYKALHRQAVALNRDTYIDPASGYSVFSQVYLKRRNCCGNGCRHCPYGHVNVPKVHSDDCVGDPNLEW